MNDTTQLNPVTELDHLFLELLEIFSQQTVTEATESAHLVYELSQEYLSEKANLAMEDFFKIYFSGNELIEQSTVDVNNDVDDILDEVQALMGADGNLSQLNHDEISENEELRDARMSLSNIQKQLESIIRLREGIEGKLMPVMANMQFENSVSQRIDHIIEGWRLILWTMENSDTTDFEMLGLELSKLTTSSEETKLFYQKILKREPPPELLQEEHTLMDFFHD